MDLCLVPLLNPLPASHLVLLHIAKDSVPLSVQSMLLVAAVFTPLLISSHQPRIIP